MIVNSIDNILDGNIYLVSQNENIRTDSATSFDGVINQISSGNESLDDIFAEVADEYGVNLNLLKAVAKAESDFDTEAVSGCGAQGIMQLMPTTAQSLGVEDPFDARQNITGGAKMLAYLLDDYNGNVSLALAAYNAGSGAVGRFGGVPPYNETLRYIDRINDILGGVLSNDSRTIDGATATDLSGSAQAENTGIIVSTSSTDSETTDAVQPESVNVSSVTANTGNYNNTKHITNGISAGSSAVSSVYGRNNNSINDFYKKYNNYNSYNTYNNYNNYAKYPVSSNTRLSLSYDDYKYVIDTYKTILSKLFAVSDSTDSKSSQSGLSAASLLTGTYSGLSSGYNNSDNNVYDNSKSLMNYYMTGLSNTSQSVLNMLGLNK